LTTASSEDRLKNDVTSYKRLVAERDAKISSLSVNIENLKDEKRQVLTIVEKKDLEITHLNGTLLLLFIVSFFYDKVDTIITNSLL